MDEGGGNTLKSITYFDDEQKCWTTFSCDDCEDLRRLKAERDAAVRDIVEAMEADLSMCVLTHQCWFCAFYNSDDCPLEKDGECAPKWRGPQQEET